MGDEAQDDGRSPWRRWEGVEESHGGEEEMLEGDLLEGGVLSSHRCGRWEVGERGAERRLVGGGDGLGSKVACGHLEGSLVDFRLSRSMGSMVWQVRTWVQLGVNSRVRIRRMRRLIGHTSIALNTSFRDDRMEIEKDLDVWDVLRSLHDHWSIHSYVHSNVSLRIVVTNVIYDLVHQRPSTINISLEPTRRMIPSSLAE